MKQPVSFWFRNFCRNRLVLARGIRSALGTASFSSEMSYTEITGGVTAAQGFLARSAYCGIKATNTDKEDIALIYSPQPTLAAGTFTTNRVKAAPVRVSMVNVRS